MKDLLPGEVDLIVDAPVEVPEFLAGLPMILTERSIGVSVSRQVVKDGILLGTTVGWFNGHAGRVGTRTWRCLAGVMRSSSA